MAPHFRPWADLHADLFLPIVDRLRSLGDCIAVRGVCTAWRSALPPGPRSPYLLVLHTFQPYDDGPPRFNTRAYALSLPMQRTFRLPTLACHSSHITCSGNGYLTVADGRRLRLLNPVSGQEIELLPLPNMRYPHRIVLRPNPRHDDYTVAAICGHDNVRKVAYMTSGDREWTIFDIATDGSKLVDLVYERTDVYCLDEHGDVQVLQIPLPQGGRVQEHNVHPLLAERVVGTRSDTPLAPPYDTLAKEISFKRLFFCEGTLYQVWQNTGLTIRLRLQAGGVFIMSSDEILVLRYYPEQWPCWDAVKDLGGYSVFIGRNNTAVVRAEAAPGLRPNCVYWIDCGLCTPWVFDMSNKTSTRCVHPPCIEGFARCWYFNGC